QRLIIGGGETVPAVFAPKVDGDFFKQAKDEKIGGGEPTGADGGACRRLLAPSQADQKVDCPPKRCLETGVVRHLAVTLRRNGANAVEFSSKAREQLKTDPRCLLCFADVFQLFVTRAFDMRFAWIGAEKAARFLIE